MMPPDFTSTANLEVNLLAMMNTLVMNPLQPCPADFDIPFVHMTPSTLLANLVLLHFLSSVFFIFFLYCHYQFKTLLITLESLLTNFFFFFPPSYSGRFHLFQAVLDPQRGTRITNTTVPPDTICTDSY